MQRARGKATITAAVIGGVSVVLAALIAGYMQRPRVLQAPQPEGIETAAVPQATAPEPAVRLTAARIGRVGASGEVMTHTTRFAREDEVAITLQIDAAPGVARLPVRVDAVLFGGPGMGRVDDFADIAVPGAQQITLRFPSEEHRFDPMFLSVEAEGQKLYSQQISFTED